MTLIHPNISHYVDESIDSQDYHKLRREKNRKRVQKAIRRKKLRKKGHKKQWALFDSRIPFHNKRTSIGHLHGQMIKILFKKQQGRCHYCETEFPQRSEQDILSDIANEEFRTGYKRTRPVPRFRRFSYHIEHLLPVSRGGGNVIENLALACADCNLKKGTQTEKEFRHKPFVPRVILRKGDRAKAAKSVTPLGE